MGRAVVWELRAEKRRQSEYRGRGDHSFSGGVVVVVVVELVLLPTKQTRGERLTQQHKDLI